MSRFTTSVSIELEYLVKIELLVKNGDYRSTSEFLNIATEEKLRNDNQIL